MNKPIRGLPGLRLVCAAILGSTLVYAGVGVALVRSAAIPANAALAAAPWVGGLFVGAGLLTTAASFLVRLALTLRLPREGGTFEERARIVLVSMAIAEAASVIGLVYALVSGTLTIPFVLWGCALGAGISHFPTRARLENDRR